jgi:Flp pilus assembly protein TadG
MTNFPAQRSRFLLRRSRARIRALVRRFHLSRSGVAAVEFALMVPVMLSVFVGMVVATDALNADKKVTLLARTLADMTTQMVAVSQSDLDSIFMATESILWPHPSTGLGMRVTAIDIDGDGKAFVDWSAVPTNGALKGSFSPVARCTNFDTLPAGLKIPRTFVVFAEVEMNYEASVATQIVNELFGGTFSNGKVKMGDTLYMRPRQANKVQFNPPPAANCPNYTP